VVVRAKRFIAFRFERFDTRFDGSFVDAYDVVVLMHFDAERVADRNDQMFLIELRVALNSVMLNVLGDVAEFRKCLVL
jgi:hypothetical protein